MRQKSEFLSNFSSGFHSSQQFTTFLNLKSTTVGQTADKYKEKQLRKEFQEIDRDGGGFVDISELSTYIIRPTVHTVYKIRKSAFLTKNFRPDFSIFQGSKLNLANNDSNLTAEKRCCWFLFLSSGCLLFGYIMC